MTACVFCEPLVAAVISENGLARALADAFPVNPGHSLIVPKRHEPDFFALSEEESAAIWGLIPAVRRHVELRATPDGYNIGVNIGEAAGQTVVHAHLHVIPRFAGDVRDPRGGIRLIIPARARYWEGL
jgi:diadenosine tetraphosphate (Ap4A) HIT family hydrolase